MCCFAIRHDPAQQPLPCLAAGERLLVFLGALQSDAGIFMNSLCGMWVLVAVVQGISLLIQAAWQTTAAQETKINIWDRLQKAAERCKPKATDSQGMILTLLRLATVLLAIVSWWSTAQGMQNYVFSQTWQANLASFAIQSILLGLNFYLPTFWRWIHSLRGKTCVLALSGVVLFCSSWFSYVFIVGTVYEKSWQTESYLLVQPVYRNELYKTDEFVQIGSAALRETLSDEVAALYAAGKTVDTGTTQNPSGLDLQPTRQATPTRRTLRQKMKLLRQSNRCRPPRRREHPRRARTGCRGADTAYRTGGNPHRTADAADKPDAGRLDGSSRCANQRSKCVAKCAVWK